MLRISGYSDDIVSANIELETKCPHCGAEVDEPSKAVVGDKQDEIGCFDEDVMFTIGSMESGVVVVMSYGPAGCWAAQIHQVAEGVEIPWTSTVAGQGYTAIVSVDCPNGTPVLVVKKKRSE